MMATPEDEAQGTNEVIREEQSTEAVRATVVQLPPFWEEDVSLWFIQVEALFQAHRLSSQHRKFQTLLSQLPFKALSQVADLARNPTTNPYDTLKERLIASYSESQERKIQKLLEETRLGDQKPSQLLRHMQTQAEDAATNPVLRTIWIRALPQRVQSILAALDQGNLNQLAAVADKIMEVDTVPSVMATHNTPSVNIIEDKSFSNLKEEIKQLRREIEALKLKNRKNPRERSKSPFQKPFCYYHYKFGTKATKCSAPCNWKHQDSTKESPTKN